MGLTDISNHLKPKIVFADVKNAKETIMRLVSPNQLEKKFGGDCENL
jgi:hypothetical protein